MKKLLLLTLAAGLSTFAAAKTAEGPKTLTGTVVDVTCYVKAGGKGAGHKKCGTACANAGMPLGILVGKKLYIAAAKDDATSVNPSLSEFVDEEVTVTGKTAERGGVSVITVEKVERVKKG